jgi:hypothetical protein
VQQGLLFGVRLAVWGNLEKLHDVKLSQIAKSILANLIITAKSYSEQKTVKAPKLSTITVLFLRHPSKLRI